MWAQSSLWACMSILVSGLMSLGPKNLYLNNGFFGFDFGEGLNLCEDLELGLEKFMVMVLNNLWSIAEALMAV